MVAQLVKKCMGGGMPNTRNEKQPEDDARWTTQ